MGDSIFGGWEQTLPRDLLVGQSPVIPTFAFSPSDRHSEFSFEYGGQRIQRGECMLIYSTAKKLREQLGHPRITATGTPIDDDTLSPVSYTHLTLPTILLV